MARKSALPAMGVTIAPGFEDGSEGRTRHPQAVDHHVGGLQLDQTWSRESSTVLLVRFLRLDDDYQRQEQRQDRQKQLSNDEPEDST